MRYFLGILCLMVVLLSTNAIAQPIYKEQLIDKEECLGKICLRQSIHSIADVNWLKLEDVRGMRWETMSFPYYRRVQVSLEYVPSFHARDAAGVLLQQIHNLSNASTLYNDVRFNLETDTLEVGPAGLRVLEYSDRAIFCRATSFAAFYRSLSGHPTVVVFTPVTMPTGDHDLVVTQIARRIQMLPNAAPSFEAKLKEDYPSLKSANDLSVKCDASGKTCEMHTLGTSRHPTKDTASEDAMLRGKDNIVYLERGEGYVDFILELFDPNSDWYTRLRSLNPNPEPRIPDRLDWKSLTQHPLCLGQPIVPPLD